MPSNYRYNPFNDASDFVSITEKRIIPLVSPFEIMLKEVPEKADPSSVTIKEITIGDDDTVEVQTFTEVAATPTQGQFWMDYNTSADGDDNWNTGRIQFSSSDAGKLVEISYTGTGTLATTTGSQDPYWFHDHGDGSDGHMFFSENTILLKNTLNCKSLIIKAGYRITPLSRYVPLIIKSQGAIIIEGEINADNFGTSGGRAGNGGGAGGAGRNSSGALGGVGIYFNGMPFAHNEFTIDYMARSGLAGCGSAGGGDGSTVSYSGGAIRIAAPEIYLAGKITARGKNAVYSSVNQYAGGGGGGTVCIATNFIVNTGTILVAGGAAANSAPAGGAGWYRIFELGDA